MTAPAPTIVERLRTGDHVFHRPSEETWVVAWADYETGYMAPCGWPTCQARIDECDLVKKATDEESARLVAAMSISRRTDANKAAEIADRAASSLSPQAAPAGAVKPLDLPTLLRDAFLTGRGLKDGDKLSEADQAAWMDYDPTEHNAYKRVSALLAAPPSSGQRVDAPLAATQGVTAPSVDALFANCDKWGAVEWFNRLAMAIRNRDKSVVEGNDLSFATYDNIAKSSAARLVHDFENEMRAALTAAIGAGGQAVEAPAQPLAFTLTVSDETKAALKAIDDAQRTAAVSLAANPPIVGASQPDGESVASDKEIMAAIRARSLHGEKGRG